MAEKTETPKVIQHLICHDERNNWKVVDIAVVSPTSVTVLLQNDREWCIDTFDCVENEYQRSKRICFKAKSKQPPLFLSYWHVENKLKHLICTKTKLHFIDDESESIERSVSLSANLSAFCVQGNKVYIFSNEAKAVMFFKLELPTETSKIYFKEISKEDSIVEFEVHSKNIYVCTKRGKVSSYKLETGDKRHDYRNRKSKNSTACGLAVFKAHVKECDLLLVTWNDNTLHVYSTNTNHDLLHITLNIPGKFKFSPSCFLMSSEVNNVAVYNTKTVADRGIFKMTLFSGSRSEGLNDLHSFVLHASMGPKPEARKLFMKRENLRTLVEMYDSSCYTIDKLHDEKKKLKILLVKKQKEVDVEKRRADEKAKELNEAKTHAEGLCRTIQEKEDKCSSLIKELSENLKVVEKARTESDDLQRMNEDKEEKCRSLTQQLEAERKTTMELKDEIDRSKKEKDDVTEELESTRSKLFRKEADLSDVRAKLDDARTDNDDLKKRLETGRKTSEEGDITKDIYADSTENMETSLEDMIDGINDDTVKLKKKVVDVTRELKSTNLTLKKKEEDCSQIQYELDAAISEKKELEKTATETDTLKQMIEVKDKEIQHLQRRLQKAVTDLKNTERQVTLLRDRKNELQALLANLEDANYRLRKEHYKAEKTQTLLSKILENLDRDALILKTESEIVMEILQTKGKQQDMLVCLQSDFNSRIEKLKREAELLEYKMGQQNKIIDFEKKNRSALPDMVEQSCTYNYKQELTAMGLEHKALPDNANTLDKETMLQTLSLTQEEPINMIHNQTQSVTVNREEILAPSQMLTGPMTKTPKENKKELVENGSTEENVSKIHHDSNLIPFTPKRLPEDEQMLETRKEGVTEVTSFQAGTYSRLEQKQNFRVTKENRQLSFIENKLQGVQDKMKYETFQFEYLKDLFESSDNLLGVLQQSTFLKTVDALVKEISNGKDKLGKLKDNRDNTVEEYEVQRDWFELHELQVSLVVSQDGGKLKIPGSDVSLDIPPGALQEQHEIHMTIIPHCLDPGGDSLSFSSNSSVVVELLPNKLQFQKPVYLRLPHCLHLNKKYNSLKDAKVLISHHDKDDAPNWDVSTDTECKLQKDHCVIPLKKFCWITCRVDDKVVTAKRLKIFTAGRDLELSDRVSEVEVGYFPDLPGSGEILRKNPKLSRGQIKPFLFHKNEGLTLQISLQQVIPSEWQNESSLGNKQIISYQSICTGTEMSCPFHLQYTPECSPRGKVPLCLFLASQENAEQINITFRPEVKCDEDRIYDEDEGKDEDEKDKSQHVER